MSFKVRGPSFKIGGVRLRRTKSGWTMSNKTIFGNRKTTNLKTGRTTKTYRSIIPGKSTQITKSISGDTKISRRYTPSISILGTRIKKTKKGISVSNKNIVGGTTTYNTGTGVKTKFYKILIPGVRYQTKKQLGKKKTD